MSNVAREQYVSRDHIMNLLSDAEVATVSTAEAAPALAVGDEYLDLEHLEQGVRQATPAAGPTTMRGVLPRKAVHPDTWLKIMSYLSTPRAPAKA